jgi:pantoate--beta-alanine ligase
MLQNHPLTVVRTIAELRRTVANWRARGLRIGVVPTMGSLHAGHLALVEQARVHNDRVIVTLFVNPLQFGANEDFATYPRDDERDFALLAERQCDVVFAPAVDEMFPDGNGSLDAVPTRVSVAKLGAVLCGGSRPGHFDGVATIVLKLLLITQPDVAYFGEKDFQQLRIVEQLTRDLCVSARIVGVPIVRDADGLALSSRNVYLTTAQRRVAPNLLRVLASVRDGLLAGGDVTRELAVGHAALRAAGFDHIDYLTLAASDTLESRNAVVPGARLFVAAFLGRTRLIDNLLVKAMSSS